MTSAEFEAAVEPPAEPAAIGPPAPELTPETWPRDDWKHLERAARLCASRAVGLILMCRTCGQAFGMEHMDNRTGELLAMCGCTIRRMRK